jgi:hypothetical protein
VSFHRGRRGRSALRARGRRALWAQALEEPQLFGKLLAAVVVHVGGVEQPDVNPVC